MRQMSGGGGVGRGSDDRLVFSRYAMGSIYLYRIYIAHTQVYVTQSDNRTFYYEIYVSLYSVCIY